MAGYKNKGSNILTGSNDVIGALDSTVSISFPTPPPMSGTVSGYTSGGFAPPFSATIDKFPFAADANATDVGDLTVARFYSTGQSSTENGYTSSGSGTGGNIIDKFPFATDTNATDVGDLTVARDHTAGQSSQENGYTSGGNTSGSTIDKFPFATDTNATNVGNLTQGREDPAGQS